MEYCDRSDLSVLIKSQQQNETGYQISRLRVHVERRITYMKFFSVLNFFPHHLLPVVDKIVRVIAFLSNNFDELIKASNYEPSEEFA